MRACHVTNRARAHLREIVAFIGSDNPDAAERYYEVALKTFADFPADILTPKPASDTLPPNVHEIAVRGFSRYTIRILIRESDMFLLCAFRLGLPNEVKDALTAQGLHET